MVRVTRTARMVSLFVLAVLVIILGVLFYQVMSGFILPMFLAVLLAIIFRPVHHAIMRSCGGRTRLAAGLTTVAILVIVLVPLLLIFARATGDALEVLSKSENLRLDEHVFERLIDQVNRWSPLQLSAQEIHDQIMGTAKDSLKAVALATPTTLGRILMGLFVTVFSLYYFLADGAEMISSGVRMLPLRDHYQMQLLEEFEEVARAVITATAVSAIAQGLLGGIGFSLAGMNSVFLLILLTMLTSMIPLIGAAPVWLGSATWLYFNDHPIAGILLGIYGLAVMLTVDNVLRPMVLHGKSKLHPLLALLSVLGGVQLLGPIGLFVGPMAVAFLQAGLNMFSKELAALDKGKAGK